MNEQIESWDDVRFFLAVARSGSLSAAARELGVEHTTVARRIQSLEDDLESRLFDRQPRGYALTQVGEELVAIAARAEDAVVALQRRAAGADQSLRGLIRLTTVGDLSPPLCEYLRTFYEQYPQIQLQMLTSDRVYRLTDREADVAIRAHRPQEPDVVGVRLVDIAAAPYASRAYLKRHGRPRRLRDLARHAIIGLDGSKSHVSTVRWINENVPPEKVIFTSNSFDAQLAAIRAGFGIGFTNCWLGDPDRDLIRLFRPMKVATFWLAYHRDLRATARIRAFVDHVRACFVENADLFEGRGPRMEGKVKIAPARRRSNR